MTTPFQIVTEEDLLRYTLLSKCRLSESGCWEWVAAKDGNGYGFVYRGNRSHRAHRMAYEAFIGPIPSGAVLCHSCDNPSCINPNHLRPGTMKDNAMDRESRGRRDVRGEQIGTAKLTEESVREIKASSLSLSALAEKYGVDKSNIWSIKSGKSWKHVRLEIAQ